MRLIADLPYAARENACFDLYLPDAETFDLVISFHGGGLEKGTRKSLLYAQDLVEQGVAVASVEYRMYPEVKFPEFLVDCAEAVKYITDHMSEYGTVRRTLLGGNSAGAYITLMLAFDEHYLADAGVDRSRIAAYVSDSSQITTHYRVLRDRGLDSRLERIDEAAVIYHLSENSSFGHLLLIAYTNDIPCRLEQNQLFFKSVQRLCPDQHVELVVLEGKHVNGAVSRNEKGTFDYNDTLLAFLKSL